MYYHDGILKLKHVLSIFAIVQLLLVLTHIRIKWCFLFLELKPETITRAAENTTHYESEGQRIVFGVRWALMSLIKAI